MKKLLSDFKTLFAVAGIISISFMCMSFHDTPFVNAILDNQEEQLDTIPEKQVTGDLNIREYDEMIKKMDESMLKAEGELKNINAESISLQVEASLKTIDIDAIIKSLETSLASIDMTDIIGDIRIALNGGEIKISEAELNEALSEVEKGLNEARLEISNIDMKEIKADMEEAKKELANVKIELKDIDKEIAEAMVSARKEVAEAKDELKVTRSMFNEMEKDGLINIKEGFTIDYKNKDLYINGKKQTQKVTDKYKKYIKGENFEIKIGKSN